MSAFEKHIFYVLIVAILQARSVKPALNCIVEETGCDCRATTVLLATSWRRSLTRSYPAIRHSYISQ